MLYNRAMKRKRTIYMLDGGTGRQYIGQSVDLNSRMHNHQSRCRHGVNCLLYHAVRKDPRGWVAFPLRILAHGWWTDEQANAAESGYIAYHDTFHNGLNMTKGGEATTGWVPSQETRDKIGAAGKGRVTSQETRDKQSAAMKGRPKSQETREKIKSTRGKYRNENINLAMQMRADGKSLRKIARCFSVTAPTIRRWVKFYSTAPDVTLRR